MPLRLATVPCVLVGLLALVACGPVASGDRRPSAGAAVPPATAADVLAVLEVRLDAPTVHALGVQVLVAGDENRNGRIAVRYRESGETAWRDGMPLFRVRPDTVAIAVPPQFAGSVFDLAPARDYEIELRAFDPDGAVDLVLPIVRGSTRAIPRADPVDARAVPVASADDLMAALAAARPGDVITLAPGAYAGRFLLAASGTADQPIVVRGESRDGVILDGGSCVGCNVLEVSGSFVHVERLTIRNAERGLRFTGENATGNVARRLLVQNVIHGIGSHTGQSNSYIADNVVDGRLQWPWALAARARRHWDDRGIEVTGDGHIVAHNRIRGFGDPVVNKKRLARSWDVYGNDIADAFDGVELDEGAGNLRLFHNRFTNVMAPISLQPVFGGPAYALRNVMFNVPDEAIKLKSLGGVEEPSGVLVYHNTVVAPARALTLVSTITQYNFVIANNLFVGPRRLVRTDDGHMRTVDWRAGFGGGTFDHNGYYPASGEFMFGTADGAVRRYADFARAQRAGVERHGVLLTEPIFRDAFVGPADPRARHAPPDFTLADASNAVDRGLRLPGVNDGFTGAAPDLGALERGCPVPSYGPRPEHREGRTWAINCGPGRHE